MTQPQCLDPRHPDQCCPGQPCAAQPKPGQRYRLSPDAAAQVAIASVYMQPQPYLQLGTDGVTLDLWQPPTEG